ncbi:MAG: hypothetical protein GY847_00185 [Proteobacteria bacterium]|nr:hypothetical protein [Pseudomonadota bacterium]
MKRFTLLVVLALFLALLVGCASGTTPTPPAVVEVAPTEPPATAMDVSTEEVAADENGPWEVVFHTEVEQPTRMAAFLDENFGVTGGAAGPGKAHYTADGGKTWTQAPDSFG